MVHSRLELIKRMAIHLLVPSFYVVLPLKWNGIGSEVTLVIYCFSSTFFVEGRRVQMNKSIKLLRTQLNSFTDDNLQFYVHVSPPRTVEREFSSPFFPPPPKKFPNVKLLKGNLAAFVLNGNFPNRQQIIWSEAYEVRAKREPKCGACGWGLGFRGVVRVGWYGITGGWNRIKGWPGSDRPLISSNLLWTSMYILNQIFSLFTGDSERGENVFLTNICCNISSVVKMARE